MKWRPLTGFDLFFIGSMMFGTYSFVQAVEAQTVTDQYHSVQLPQVYKGDQVMEQRLRVEGTLNARGGITGEDGGAVAGFNSSATIIVNGRSLDCVPASGVAAGCLNGTTQSVGGAKTWTGNSTFAAQVDLQGNIVMRGQAFCLQPSGCIFVADDANLPVSFTDSVGSQASTSSFTFQSGNNRYAGPIAVFRNGVVESLRLDAQSNLLTGCAPNPDGGQSFCGSFVDNSGVSGHPSLTAGRHLYVVLEAQMDARYWAEHGWVTINNANDAMAGYPFEIENVDVAHWGGYTEILGARSNKKLMVNYQGGIHWGGAYSLSQFAPCGNYENHPVNDGGGELEDGGDSYYTATDGGVAQEATLQWATDKQDLYVCTVPGTNPPVLPDGGAQVDGTWYPLHISSTQPSLGQVTIGGGGTALAAVQAGQHCQCTYDTAGTVPLTCHVSGSTLLTVTGTIGAVVNYRCDT